MLTLQQICSFYEEDVSRAEKKSLYERSPGARGREWKPAEMTIETAGRMADKKQCKAKVVREG